MLVDELHLLLRIGGVLVKNLVHEMVLADKQAHHTTGSTSTTRSPLRLLESKIGTECKVTFRIWEARDESGKPSGKYEWTSVMGTDLKKILRILPSSFSDLLRPEIQTTMCQIWKASKQT